LEVETALFLASATDGWGKLTSQNHASDLTRGCLSRLFFASPAPTYN